MSVVDVVVIVVGASLIIGELWYFLGPRRPEEPPRQWTGGVQEVPVLVKGGYDPDTIFVEAARPVRLLFYRDETVPCSARVVFPDFDIDEALPPFETTSIEFTPSEAGDFPFSCGLGVLKGRIVAQIGRDRARANLGKGHSSHG